MKTRQKNPVLKLDGDEPDDFDFDEVDDNTWGSGDEGYGGDGFGNRVEGTRAVLFDHVADIDPLRHGWLIEQALTYRLRKKKAGK